MDGGAWWAAVHGVANSRTRLSDFTFTFMVNKGTKWREGISATLFHHEDSRVWCWLSLSACGLQSMWGKYIIYAERRFILCNSSSHLHSYVSRGYRGLGACYLTVYANIYLKSVELGGSDYICPHSRNGRFWEWAPMECYSSLKPGKQPTALGTLCGCLLCSCVWFCS